MGIEPAAAGFSSRVDKDIIASRREWALAWSPGRQNPPLIARLTLERRYFPDGTDRTRTTLGTRLCKPLRIILKRVDFGP